MYRINEFEDQMIPSMKPEALRKQIKDTYGWTKESEFAWQHLQLLEDQDQNRKVVTKQLEKKEL